MLQELQVTIKASVRLTLLKKASCYLRNYSEHFGKLLARGMHVKRPVPPQVPLLVAALEVGKLKTNDHAVCSSPYFMKLVRYILDRKQR